MEPVDPEWGDWTNLKAHARYALELANTVQRSEVDAAAAAAFLRE